MWPRLSIVAGLVSGVAVAVLVLGSIVAFAPDPVPAATAVPSVVPSLTVPSRPPAASSGASGSPDAGASGDAAFHVGEPAPPLVVPQVGGGTIDLASSSRLR